MKKDLSCQDLSLDEVNSVVEDPSISTTLLNDVTILLATSILFKDWGQWPLTNLSGLSY